MIQKILLWICKWAYRKLKHSNGRNEFGGIPTGIPHMRDPHALCTSYSPRKRKMGDFKCGGDGHYLCKEECAFYVEGFEFDEEDEFQENEI